MIEIVTFRLRPGADVEAFLAVDRSVQTGVAYQCPGMLRRTVARDGDRWLVLQIWATPQACATGSRAIDASAAGGSFRAFVDPATITIDRFGEVD